MTERMDNLSAQLLPGGGCASWFQADVRKGHSIYSARALHATFYFVYIAVPMILLPSFKYASLH